MNGGLISAISKALSFVLADPQFYLYFVKLSFKKPKNKTFFLARFWADDIEGKKSRCWQFRSSFVLNIPSFFPPIILRCKSVAHRKSKPVSLSFSSRHDFCAQHNMHWWGGVERAFFRDFSGAASSSITPKTVRTPVFRMRGGTEEEGKRHFPHTHIEVPILRALEEGKRTPPHPREKNKSFVRSFSGPWLERRWLI